ncbi:hypothetical protein [Thermicanus aegyptius]|uniref:hypothetical protein n=1 Tax=Thermicanus aegyptius TaxID=94009 RepID=UPI000408D58B|nr:hypothetical protein [Thermicanus aegyptius]
MELVYKKSYKTCEPYQVERELDKIMKEQAEKHGWRFVRRTPMGVVVHPSRDEMITYRYKQGEIIEEKFVWM